MWMCVAAVSTETEPVLFCSAKLDWIQEKKKKPTSGPDRLVESRVVITTDGASEQSPQPVVAGTKLSASLLPRGRVSARRLGFGGGGGGFHLSQVYSPSHARTAEKPVPACPPSDLTVLRKHQRIPAGCLLMTSAPFPGSLGEDVPRTEVGYSCCPGRRAAERLWWTPVKQLSVRSRAFLAFFQALFQSQ